MKISELYEKIRDGVIVSDIDLQREIIYDTDKQRLVIDSILNDVPLPAFYLWDNNGKLEVLDGKQRIEAIKKFKENDLEYNNKIWKLTDTNIQEKFNETELAVIICCGEEELKRKIFNRINTLGVPLSPYEVLNGLYHGEYLRGLTLYVSNDKDALKVLGQNSRGKNQMRVIKYICILKEIKNLNDYVKEIKDKSFADDSKFTDKNKEIEDIIQAIVNGISVDEKRLFTIDDKRELLAKSLCENGKYQCTICKKWFYPDELQMDHKEAWSKGGRTVLSNAALLCGPCNRKKSNL